MKMAAIPAAAAAVALTPSRNSFVHRSLRKWRYYSYRILFCKYALVYHNNGSIVPKPLTSPNDPPAPLPLKHNTGVGRMSDSIP